MSEPSLCPTRTLGKNALAGSRKYLTREVVRGGRGQPVERSVCFVDEGNWGTSHLSPRFRMLEEAVTQALRRGNSRNRWIAAACSWLHFTPSLLSFLDSGRCSGPNVSK